MLIVILYIFKCLYIFKLTRRGKKHVLLIRQYVEQQKYGHFAKICWQKKIYKNSKDITDLNMSKKTTVATFTMET
jgi:hypothetical protein